MKCTFTIGKVVHGEIKTITSLVALMPPWHISGLARPLQAIHPRMAQLMLKGDTMNRSDLFEQIAQMTWQGELKWRQYLTNTHASIQLVMRNSQGLIELPTEEYQTYLKFLAQAYRMTNRGQLIVYHMDFQAEFGAAVTALCEEIQRRTLEAQRGFERLRDLITDPQALEASLRAALDQATAEATARLNKTD